MKLQLSAIRPYRLLLLLLSILVTNAVYADNNDLVQQLQDQASQQRLWQQSEWINLLHMEGDGETSDDYHSSIRDKQFFLADNGSNNAEAELLATIASIYNARLKDDLNPQCKYIARFNWLNKNLVIDPDTLPKVKCEKYISWRKDIQPEHVTLIFPTYHLNSPSSMFGHTLLRLDPGVDKGESKWLSVAINFGANTPDGENSLLYAYKGLAGGYPGLFVTDYYYKKIQEYNRIEHRDIWEYRLNLTPEETELMVTHLWELQNVNFDYFFFDENCSYRLLELLEVARPGTELTDEFVITAIPIDTVKAIQKIGMIESLEYRPARATILSYMLDQIPETQHKIAIQLSEDIDTHKKTEFTNLPEDEQRQLIEIAYKYLRYQQAEEGRNPAIAKRSFELLKLRNTYPESSAAIVPPPISPDKGHGSKRATFAAGRRLDNYYGEFGFKMSFHDLEDNEQGFLQGASINIGSIQVRAEENETLRLYRLDFVDIFSLAPRTDFFKPVAWRVYTGFERQFTKGVDQLGYHVTGGGGGNWKFLGDNQFYALATGRLEINKQLDHSVEPGIGFITGLLSHFGSNTARLEVSGEHFTGDTYRLRAQYTHNFVISTNNSLKFYAKYEWQENNTEFSDINLGYQYYF
jgi:cell division protein FtsL